jgi:hypothetical protein
MLAVRAMPDQSAGPARPHPQAHSLARETSTPNSTRMVAKLVSMTVLRLC